MRKNVLGFFAALSILLLAACGSQPNTYPITEYAEEVSAPGSDAYQHFPAEPHPLAMALRAYTEDYDGVVRAFWVTLDDQGTTGVLATKTPEWVLFNYDWQEYGYISVATLFFMEGGQVRQVGASGLFAAGKYNRLMDRLYAHTHIVEYIYALENGQLQPTTRLEYFADDYLLQLFNYDPEAIAGTVASRNNLREMYGLEPHPVPNPWLMEGIEDQTALILAMTIHCEPRVS